MTAGELRALHVPGQPLVLPNAWDASSARLVAEAGFPVVATSSAAVAKSLGYEDGEQAPVDEMFAAAARMAAAVDVPLTVDAEAGYGLAPDELVARLLEAGAVGCNLEDTDLATGSLRDPAEHASWLAAVRSAAGDALVINARVDSFLGGADEASALPDAIDRAKRYLDAGADCVYPILLHTPQHVGAFVAAVRPAPVNIVGPLDGLDRAAAAELGVARISLGPQLFYAEQASLRDRLARLA